MSNKKDQLEREFKALKYLEKYNIAPKAFYLDMKGFTYPLMIEEFIKGKPLNRLTSPNLSKIAFFIAQVNKIPLKKGHPFEDRKPDYKKDLQRYYRVFKKTMRDKSLRKWKNITEDFFTKIDKIIKTKQKLLSKIKPCLINADANPTNFIFTKEKLKMVDWEVVRVDDPTKMLAGFINETQLYDFFKQRLSSKQKQFIIKEYLKYNKIQNFEELLEIRLLLEQIDGLTWGFERVYLSNQKFLRQDLVNRNKLKWYNMIIQRSYKALVNY